MACVMFVLLTGTDASGFNASAAAKPCGTFFVCITWITLLVTRSFACSYAIIIFELLVNTYTFEAFIF